MTYDYNFKWHGDLILCCFLFIDASLIILVRLCTLQGSQNSSVVNNLESRNNIYYPIFFNTDKVYTCNFKLDNQPSMTNI